MSIEKAIPLMALTWLTVLSSSSIVGSIYQSDKKDLLQPFGHFSHELGQFQGADSLQRKVKTGLQEDFEKQFKLEAKREKMERKRRMEDHHRSSRKKFEKVKKNHHKKALDWPTDHFSAPNTKISEPIKSNIVGYVGLNSNYLRDDYKKAFKSEPLEGILHFGRRGKHHHLKSSGRQRSRSNSLELFNFPATSNLGNHQSSKIKNRYHKTLSRKLSSINRPIVSSNLVPQIHEHSQHLTKKKHQSKSHKSSHTGHRKTHFNHHSRTKKRLHGSHRVNDLQNQVFSPRSYSSSAGIMSIPELEGYVLEDYPDENDSFKEDSKLHHAGSFLGKPSEIDERNSTPSPKNVEDLTIGVEKFEDFDLTVLDVPSLSSYPELIIRSKKKISPQLSLITHSSNSKYGPKHKKITPTITISEASDHSDKKYDKAKKNHHISRRVGVDAPISDNQNVKLNENKKTESKWPQLVYSKHSKRGTRRSHESEVSSKHVAKSRSRRDEGEYRFNINL